MKESFYLLSLLNTDLSHVCACHLCVLDAGKYFQSLSTTDNKLARCSLLCLSSRCCFSYCCYYDCYTSTSVEQDETNLLKCRLFISNCLVNTNRHMNYQHQFLRVVQFLVHAILLFFFCCCCCFSVLTV